MLIVIAAATAAIVGCLCALLGLKHIWTGVIVSFIFVMIIGELG